MEIDQFCESMGCDYVEVSVLEDWGIEELMKKVIQKCMDGRASGAKKGDEVQAMVLQEKIMNSKKKKKQGCC